MEICKDVRILLIKIRGMRNDCAAIVDDESIDEEKKIEMLQDLFVRVYCVGDQIVKRMGITRDQLEMLVVQDWEVEKITNDITRQSNLFDSGS